MDYVDILESRVALPESPGRRALAWSEAIVQWSSDPDVVARMVQAAIDEETRRCLLAVERTIVNTLP